MYRLSPVSHKFESLNEQAGEKNAYRLPSKDTLKIISSGNAEIYLEDVTHLYRAGFRGSKIIDWLESVHGIEAPAINQSSINEEGLLILRLSQTEFLFQQSRVESSTGFENFINKAHTTPLSEDCPEIFYLPRQDSHACFRLGGNESSKLFSSLCAVDLRAESFANGAIAQTSLARTGAIVVRQDMEGVPSYFVLVDSASAEYLWDCLAN